MELQNQLQQVRTKILVAEKSKASVEKYRQRNHRNNLVTSMIEKGMTVPEASHYFGVSRPYLYTLMKYRSFRKKHANIIS